MGITGPWLALHGNINKNKTFVKVNFINLSNEKYINKLALNKVCVVNQYKLYLFIDG